MIKPGNSGLPGSCRSKSSGSAPNCQKLFTRADRLREQRTLRILHWGEAGSVVPSATRKQLQLQYPGKPSSE
ncbi:hypothetical protein NQZ68_032073 [Dissostichus eleginoides]|nr:hypothetical protein NQZ68_032073 [Dissostichus eleginoides]